MFHIGPVRKGDKLNQTDRSAQLKRPRLPSSDLRRFLKALFCVHHGAILIEQLTRETIQVLPAVPWDLVRF